MLLAHIRVRISGGERDGCGGAQGLGGGFGVGKLCCRGESTTTTNLFFWGYTVETVVSPIATKRKM